MSAEPDDPFADLTLDEDFVLGATRQELSAEDRERRAAEARRAHNDLRRRQRRERRQLKRRRALKVARVVLVVALIGGATAFVSSRLGRSSASASSSIDFLRPGVPGDRRPPPQPAESDHPLGLPPSSPAGGGPYQFMERQDGSDDPVTYDPCRTIPVVVNNRTAPIDSDLMLGEALRRVTQVTGLHFHVEGTTDEAPSDQRQPYQPDRYGERWAPVLIAWTDPYETAGLQGDIAGLGGSAATTTPGADGATFVTGIVYLDGPSLGPLDVPASLLSTRAVVLHELGHLVGLNHVDGVSQLMDSHGQSGITDFQAGDLTGLARLGAGPCRSRL